MSEPLESYAEENGSAGPYIVEGKAQKENLKRSRFDLKRYAPDLVDVGCALGIDVSSWYSLWNLLLVPSGDHFNVAKFLVYGALTGLFLYSYKTLNEVAERLRKNTM